MPYLRVDFGNLKNVSITCITKDLLKIQKSIDSNLWISTKTGNTLFLKPVLHGEEHNEPGYRLRGPKPLSYKQQDMLLVASKLQNDLLRHIIQFNLCAPSDGTVANQNNAELYYQLLHLFFQFMEDHCPAPVRVSQAYGLEPSPIPDKIIIYNVRLRRALARILA